MKTTKNQEDEIRYFEQFSQHYELPPGTVEYKDRPDVTIHGERSIGIEIALLFKADGSDFRSEQRQRQQRVNIVELAERDYLSKGGRKIEISLDFDPSFPIERERISQIARSVADLALKASTHHDTCVMLNPLDDTPELSFLYHDGKEYPNSKWRYQQSYDVPALSVARVKEMVQQKISKLPGYEKRDAYWLLIIIDFWNPAQDQGIDWPSGEYLAPTPFERVLLYRPAFAQVVEVPQK